MTPLHESTEIKMARYDVEASRERLEESFNVLEDKLRNQARRWDDLKYRARAPERFVRRNPWLAAGLLAGAGFWIGTRLYRRYGAGPGEIASPVWTGRYATEPERSMMETDYLEAPGFARRSGNV
jgi:ElaB/YqjD/DUF883 family membrane-anchored ribosome-binding protein